MSSSGNHPSTIVLLNIGGKKFSTTVETLTLREPNSMLAAMFSGRHNLNSGTSDTGYIFIDRDGTHFRHILNWLRDGAIPNVDYRDAMELLREAEFFQMDGLIGQINANYVGSDLTRVDIIKSMQSSLSSRVVLRLRGANLPGIDLSGLDLRGADLRNANLKGAVLKGANLRGAKLKGANLKQSILIGAKFSGANLTSVDLSEANMEGVNLTLCILSYANLMGANLTNANLSGLDLSSTTLNNVNLEGANLQQANLMRANLAGVNLINANLKQAELGWVNMASANLVGANISCVFLKPYANFQNANLDNANLGQSVLFLGPNMQGMNLSRAFLQLATIKTTHPGTNLDEVALKYNINLTGANLVNLRFVVQRRFRV